MRSLLPLERKAGHHDLTRLTLQLGIYPFLQTSLEVLPRLLPPGSRGSSTRLEQKAACPRLASSPLNAVMGVFCLGSELKEISKMLLSFWEKAACPHASHQEVKPPESHHGLKHLGPQLGLSGCVVSQHQTTAAPASFALFSGKGHFSGVERKHQGLRLMCVK